MFKQTRIKIIAATIAALLLFLLIAMGVIYTSSYHEIQNQNKELLERFCERYDVRDMIPPPENMQPGIPPESFAGETDGMDEDPDDDDYYFDDDQDYDSGFWQKRPMDGRGERHAFELSTFYSVAVSDDGEVLAVDCGNGDLFDEDELAAMALDILESGSGEGSGDSVIYLVKEKDGYDLVAFMDTSIAGNNLATLLKYTLISFAISVVIVFFLSLFLSKKIIEPLEENDRRQKQFVSDAGHELKTPLAVMSANCELLSKEIGENKWLDNIEYENRRMSTLVKDLLDLSRAESGVLQEEDVDLSNLVTGEALPFESIAFEKGLMLDTDIHENIHIKGNPTQLRQLAAILIDNAISHSEGGEKVDLSLSSDSRHAVLQVTNSGKEIPPEKQALIFERFYKVDEARTESEGSHYGLGLAIAKAITQAHGGRIGVECRGGKVTFKAELPVKQ